MVYEKTYSKVYCDKEQNMPKNGYCSFYGICSTQIVQGWMDGWLGFNDILSTQVATISCPRKFKVYQKGQWPVQKRL